jgi:hypothetical protein
MARGYPDFFGYSVFPFHGSPMDVNIAYDGEVSPCTLTPFNIAAKGRVESCFLAMYGNVAAVSFGLSLIIDDTVFTSISAIGHLARGCIPGSDQRVIVLRYDPDSFNYTFGIKPGLTFGYRFKVQVTAAGAGLVGGVGSLMYYNVVS